MSTKITADHLRRRALVYVRQSTMGQVLENRESQRRQYALAGRAKELGFVDVDVIDEDLGRSGSGLVARPGFERLVATVCGGTVGAIFCIEASRLARNGRDWHHLIDFCSLVGTLIVDPDGVYDPRFANDRLLLGLKGTMSEFELTLFRQRSLEAKRAKAQRGELQFRLPIGLRWSEDGRIQLDPDLRVQEAIKSVFRRFEELGSVRQVLLAMRAENVRVPASVDCSERIEWKLPVYNTIHKLLSNPVYAGAYVYGKTEGRTVVVGERAQKTFGHRKPTQDWLVLIKEHHPGYISWAQFEQNKRTIASNTHMMQHVVGKAGRGGRALLTGLLRCRRCGRMLLVVYGGRNRNRGVRYACRGANVNHGHGKLDCLSFGALRVDEAIAHALLDAVSARAIEEAIELAERMAGQRTEAHRAVALEVEQARYEAKLAGRRYEAVDPDKRLVAAELEARWNAALQHMRDLECRLDEMMKAREAEVIVDREKLLSLAESLPNTWNSPAADARLKQRIVRMLAQEILADVDATRSEVVLVIHWRGGRHTELRVPKIRTGQHRRKASIEAEEVIRRMAKRWSNEQIAATLNRMRLRTGTGLSWNESRVHSLRNRMNLSAAISESEPHEPRRTLTLADAEKRLGVSNTSVLRLIRSGLITATQVAPNAPYEIDPESLDSPAVEAAIRRTRERGRHVRAYAADRHTLTLPGIELAPSRRKK
jgi:DNA invertase Pin-like site-specific DNA recombinase